MPFEKEIEAAPAAGAKVGVPHPLVVSAGVAATTMAPGATGKVSENATPLKALFWFGFVIAKVSVETPPARIGFGANCFDMTGGRTAVSDAVAIPVGPVFVPLSVAETKALTFSWGPAVVAVTVAVMEQEAPAASVPAAKEIVLGAAVVSVPPHCTDEPPATVTPAGSVSMNATPLKADPTFGFVTVKLRVVEAPTATGSGEKLLVMVGGLGFVQPVKMIVSRYIGSVRPLAPTAFMRKVVVLVPVVAAGTGPMVCHDPFGRTWL